MILKRLVINNFRQFKDRTTIDLSPIDDKHITLIYASNGVGKTTLLSSIVWCLYGGESLEYVDQKNIFLNKTIFKELPENGELEVSVMLIFEDRGRRHTISRSVVVKKVNSLQKLKDHDLKLQINSETQHNPQEKINSVLSPSLKEYFFFKGEGVQKFAQESNYKKVQDGIKNIMKIDTREKALKYIEDTRTKFTKELNEISTNLGDKDSLPEEKKENLIQEKNAIENQILEIEKDIEIFDEILKKVEENILEVNEIKRLSKERLVIKNNVNDLEQKIETLNIKKRSMISQEAYLALSQNVMESVSKLVTTKKNSGVLPVGIRKKFIEDLLREHVCICGTEFLDGDEHYHKLMAIMENVSGDSVVEDSLNDLSYFVETYKSFTPKYINNFYELVKEIELIEKKLNSELIILNSLEDDIENELPQNEENLIIKKNNTVIERDQKIENKVKSYIRLEQIEKELKEIEVEIDNFRTNNDSINLIRKRIGFCSKSIDLLSQENSKIINDIREELSFNINKKFKSILHAQKNAKIDDDFRLIITEELGEEIVSGKSDGEGQLISLLFISTLIDLAKKRELNRSNESIDPGAGIYPIVIDSPYGQFDTVYKQYISEVVRDMSPQVIILMNQEQWNNGKDLYPIFKENLAHEYLLEGHRPKLNSLLHKVNKLESNGISIDMEVVDDEEFTLVKNLKDFYE